VSIDRLLRQQAQIVRRTQDGPDDEYGDPTWQTTVVEVYCHVQPVSSDELDGLPDGRIRWRCWLPADTSIGASDRLVLAVGLEAEVFGPAREWTDPRTATVHHLEVDLAEVAP